MALFYETGLIADQSFTLRKYALSTFTPVTWPDYLPIWTWHVFCGDIPDVWKLTSYDKSFECCCMTECKYICILLCMVTFGHMTKMAATSLDPS